MNILFETQKSAINGIPKRFVSVLNQGELMNKLIQKREQYQKQLSRLIMSFAFTSLIFSIERLLSSAEIVQLEYVFPETWK